MITRFLARLEAYLESHHLAVYLFLLFFYLVLVSAVVLFARIAYSH